MKILLGAQTDTVIITDFPWPEGAPLPAVGDDVLAPYQGRSIHFLVTGRHIAPGTDIQGNSATQVMLTISTTDPL